ncbi:MAG: glycolate oxidase subunit GlcF [Burkholderiaceae bacterium]|jgi:glycolate oxidase iron-sulfur subunit|nr:glycolate oxidase subunit GlcF [Burkholderiaceae bacterium]MDP4969208.1 glycolate oxidase subunit GlcF [Burkholderiaceae bacterium]MDP5111200.1 glycolate oxidase subunit GlcF [Burkholderiaceae bacterium]
MQTNLAQWARDSKLGQEADDILRRCVHCGFCSATCPTYQVLGDELDSPRGRIYLIKEVLEGKAPSLATQQHLDRCLTCRNCETTCPSGVEYGHLVDIGRQIVEEKVQRPLSQRLARKLLREGLTSRLFAPAYKLGQSLRDWLPETLQRKVIATRPVGDRPFTSGLARQVLLLSGCVQPTMMPSIDAASIRVLNRLGIGTQVVAGAGCCGALSFHLDDQERARAQMRQNIDAWLPYVESGKIEAIVMNASGCGAMVVEYAHHLRDDPVYLPKAEKIVSLVRDIAQVVGPHAQALAQHIDVSKLPQRPVFHPPCTLQHWQGLRPASEQLLAALGLTLQPFTETHLCCGSAGAYSVLQPEIATKLRDRKLDHLNAAKPDMMLSSNIGCIGHLQSGTDTPVRHWIEAVDAALK